MFSKSCKYAIRAILYLATEKKEEEKAGVMEIANNLGVPRYFLAKILQDLSRKGVISSIKGPGGGFFLSEKNMDVTLYEIVETVDGPGALQGCVLGFPACSSANPCSLHGQVYGYREGLRFQLENQTVRELSARTKRKGLNL